MRSGHSRKGIPFRKDCHSLAGGHHTCPEAGVLNGCHKLLLGHPCWIILNDSPALFPPDIHLRDTIHSLQCAGDRPATTGSGHPYHLEDDLLRDLRRQDFHRQEEKSKERRGHDSPAHETPVHSKPADQGKGTMLSEGMLAMTSTRTVVTQSDSSCRVGGHQCIPLPCCHFARYVITIEEARKITATVRNIGRYAARLASAPKLAMPRLIASRGPIQQAEAKKAPPREPTWVNSRFIGSPVSLRRRGQWARRQRWAPVQNPPRPPDNAPRVIPPIRERVKSPGSALHTIMT